jgi:hypothetical protein
MGLGRDGAGHVWRSEDGSKVMGRAAQS